MEIRATKMTFLPPRRDFVCLYLLTHESRYLSLRAKIQYLLVFQRERVVIRLSTIIAYDGHT